MLTTLTGSLRALAHPFASLYPFAPVKSNAYGLVLAAICDLETLSLCQLELVDGFRKVSPFYAAKTEQMIKILDCLVQMRENNPNVKFDVTYPILSYLSALKAVEAQIPDELSGCDVKALPGAIGNCLKANMGSLHIYGELGHDPNIFTRPQIISYFIHSLEDDEIANRALEQRLLTEIEDGQNFVGKPPEPGTVDLTSLLEHLYLKSQGHSSEPAQPPRPV